MNKEINIIIAEDQKMFRDTIVPALSEAGINTIAQAAHGLELLVHLKSKSPDIILLDIEMPEMDGKQALNIVKKTYPHIKIIMLTHYIEECVRTDFMEKGADGFVSKSEDLSVIIDTIREVKMNQHTKFVTTKKAKFTKRELLIIPLICAGKTMKEIANLLGIAEKSVDGHCQRLYRKTDTNSKASLVGYCVKNGLNYLG